MKFATSIAAAALALGMASGANAALVDFTSLTQWPDSSATPNVAGATVSVSATGGLITQNLDGAPGPIGPLAGETDGFGVNNDEITFPAQSITVTFSRAVRVTALYFLDLFIARDNSDEEEAVATFSGGEVVSTIATATVPGFGFGSNDLGPKGIITTSITFTAASTNDNIGNPDFALAGIEAAVVPLPAAGWLFLSALGGMGLLARRRNA